MTNKHWKSNEELRLDEQSGYSVLCIKAEKSHKLFRGVTKNNPNQREKNGEKKKCEVTYSFELIKLREKLSCGSYVEWELMSKQAYAHSHSHSHACNSRKHTNHFKPNQTKLHCSSFFRRLSLVIVVNCIVVVVAVCCCVFCYGICCWVIEPIKATWRYIHNVHS